jgi:hypothetical protein
MLSREAFVRLIKLSTTAPADRLREHVAIIAPVFADRILSGRKTIECRLTKVRGPAFECVHAGDSVHFREKGGGFRLQATVAGALHIRGLTPRGLGAIRDLFGTDIAASEAFWRSRRGARYASLIWLTDVRATPESPALWRWPGFRDRSAWGSRVVMPSHSPLGIPAKPVTCWKREA